MKHLIPLICALLGIAQVLIDKSPVTTGLGIMLVLLVSPALYGQIHDMLPSAKRKAKQQQKDFENALEYMEFVKHVYLHPTVYNMRKLSMSGLREKMVEMCVHQPHVYKMTIEGIGGWDKYNAFLRKIDDSKRSEEWKILDDFGIDENKLMEHVS